MDFQNSDIDLILENLFNFFQYSATVRRYERSPYYKLPLRLITKSLNEEQNIVFHGKHPKDKSLECLFYFEGIFENNHLFTRKDIYEKRIRIGSKYESLNKDASVSIFILKSSQSDNYPLLPHYLPTFLSH